MSAYRSHVVTSYHEGYEEGYRTGLHLVVPMQDSSVYQTALDETGPDTFGSRRAYWLGMRRGIRHSYDLAYRPVVLEARKRWLEALQRCAS